MDLACFRFIIEIIVTAALPYVPIVVVEDDLKRAEPQGPIHIEHLFELAGQLVQRCVVQNVARMNQTLPGILLLGCLQVIHGLICCRIMSGSLDYDCIAAVGGN